MSDFKWMQTLTCLFIFFFFIVASYPALYFTVTLIKSFLPSERFHLSPRRTQRALESLTAGYGPLLREKVLPVLLDLSRTPESDSERWRIVEEEKRRSLRWPDRLNNKKRETDSLWFLFSYSIIRFIFIRS